MRSSGIARLGAAVIAALVILGAPAPARSEEPPPGDLDEAVVQHRRSRSALTGRDRELAQYRLAIALYRAHLPNAAYGVFAAISEQPAHAEHRATLGWLAKLATELPEPADVDERIAAYDEGAIEELERDRPELQGQLWFSRGRRAYESQQYEDALRFFAKVGASARLRAKAVFLEGMSNVQLRRPIEAVRSFQQVLDATGAAAPRATGEEARLHELARLSIARTYYSAAVRIDGRGRTAIHRRRLAAAIETWNAVDGASEGWAPALFEEAWAYFVSGDHARALGNVRTLKSVYFQRGYRPEVDVLESAVYVANCQYDDAAALTARFQARHQPLASELTSLLAAFDGADQDDRLYRFVRDVASARSGAPPPLAALLADALGDRQLLRHLHYVTLLEDEQKRLASAPAAFRASELGAELLDSELLGRDIAVRNAAELARQRLKRALAELDEHLRDNLQLLAGALAGRRGSLDPALVPLRVPGRDADRNVVRGDDEHVLWPFTGEYWADEVGTYRQSIRSKCR